MQIATIYGSHFSKWWQMKWRPCQIPIESTCRPIIILISENQIYILFIYSAMFHCISTVCLNCFNLKESSFCILSFKTEEVSMPAKCQCFLYLRHFISFTLNSYLLQICKFSILRTLHNPNYYIIIKIFIFL